MKSAALSTLIFVLLGACSATPTAAPSATAQPTATLPASPTATQAPTRTPLGGGNYIAVAAQNSGRSEIEMLDADGTVLGHILGNSDDGQPAWSPDGTKIAFTTISSGALPEIYVVNTDGTSRTNLTNDESVDFTPAWSPDGTKIAFSSNREGDFDIYIMNADGGNVTRLTKSTGADLSPAWSPGGSRIAFTSDRGGPGDIYLINVDGTGEARLTKSPANDRWPAWAPDGSKIAFHSDRDGNAEVYTMDPDGDHPVNITKSSGDDSSPAWSPDASRIAFISNRDDTTHLCTTNIDGSNVNCWQGEYDSPAWAPHSVSVALEPVQTSTPTPEAGIVRPSPLSTPIAGNSRWQVALTGYRVLKQTQQPARGTFYLPAGWGRTQEFVFVDLGLHVQRSPDSAYKHAYGVNVYISDTNGRKWNPVWMGSQIPTGGQVIEPLEDIRVTWDLPSGVNSFRLWDIVIEEDAYVRVVFVVSPEGVQQRIAVDFQGVPVVILR